MSDPSRRIVVALGGNAISRQDEEGNIPQQFAHSRETADHLVRLIESGFQPIITHGNGPQVGNILRRVELSAGEIYPIPLHLCVADTQAGMGFMICECLNNALRRAGRNEIASTIVTSVVVDLDDPAFKGATKPIGRFIPREQAERFAAEYGWIMKQFGESQFRRVVASPEPKSVLEIDMIRLLVDAGHIIVAGGGGGIPIAANNIGVYVGVDCVVDKDRTTALLAAELGIPNLLIATGADRVMLNYGKPDAQPLDRLSIPDARKYAAEGQFPPGTLGPKIDAAIDFLEKSKDPNATVIITDLENMTRALKGEAGTQIVRG